MKKQTFLKIFVLMLIFSLALPTMTGCGANFGNDENVFKRVPGYKAGTTKGTYITILLEGCEPDYGDGEGLLKRPLFLFAQGRTSNGSQLAGAGFKLPILHYLTHYMVSLIGRNDMTCGPYSDVCDAGSGIQFDPFEIAGRCLAAGRDIGSKVGGATKGLAMSLMFVIWFANWLTMIVQERFTPEAFIKGCCMLIIGAFFVNNATDLAGAFVSLLGDSGGGGSLNLNGFTLAQVDYVYLAAGLNIPIVQSGVPLGYMFIDAIIPSLLTIVGAVIILLAEVQCAVAMASALVPAGIEIGLRIQAAPIMFALTSQTGWGPPMISYLKGCVAAGLTPVLIMTLITNANDFNFFPGLTGTIPSAIAISISLKIVSGFVGQMSGIVHQVISH